MNFSQVTGVHIKGRKPSPLYPSTSIWIDDSVIIGSMC